MICAGPTMRPASSADGADCNGQQVRRTSSSEPLVVAAFLEHHDALVAYARSLTSDADAAQDVVQVVFEKVCRSPDGLADERGTIRAWLMTITRNTAIDQIRWRVSRPTTPLDDAAECAGAQRYTGRRNSSGLAMRDHSQLVVDRSAVADAVTRLPVQQRIIVSLVYLQGYTPTEAAVLLGIPAGTARSRAFSALRSLRRLLVDDESRA